MWLNHDNCVKSLNLQILLIFLSPITSQSWNVTVNSADLVISALLLSLTIEHAPSAYEKRDLQSSL